MYFGLRPPIVAPMTDSTINSLGFAKPPEQTRVVVAMSGGVDSSVCAAMLHEQGYEVIGVTLQLLPKKSTQDAQNVAKALGIPLHIINREERFKSEIIEAFANSYLRGETPIPCAHCNQTIKFGDMLDFARSLNADCMVTGHYVRREIGKTGHAYLMRGADAIKDQSYFLFAISQDQIDYLRFPLGMWSKNETRKQARRLGLITAEKTDSQDICFVPDGDYAGLVKSLHPEAGKPGKIVHIDGREVGEHKGIIHYTIGQRKGLGIGGGVSENNSPLYVIELKPEENQVIVGPKEALARDTLHIKDCNWLADITEETQIMLKFRSVMKPTPALLQIDEQSGTAEIHLKTPQYGIATGQAAVCYIDERMIGGGWINRTSRKK